MTSLSLSLSFSPLSFSPRFVFSFSFLFCSLSVVCQTKTNKIFLKKQSTVWFRLLCLYIIAKLEKEEISFCRFATGRNETDYSFWSNKSCSVIFKLQIWSQQNILLLSTAGHIVNCSNHVIFGAIKHTHKTVKLLFYILFNRNYH